jgi:hypothetical protein
MDNILKALEDALKAKNEEIITLRLRNDLEKEQNKLLAKEITSLRANLDKSLIFLVTVVYQKDDCYIAKQGKALCGGLKTADCKECIKKYLSLEDKQ